MSYFYRAYGLGIVTSNRIGGLYPLSSRPERPSLSLEDGPEPDWVRELLTLPAVILSRRSEPAGSAGAGYGPLWNAGAPESPAPRGQPARRSLFITAALVALAAIVAVIIVVLH